MPNLIIAVDPDSTRTAYAFAVWDAEREGYRYVRSGGGGTGKPVPWGTITGQLELLSGLLEEWGTAEGDECLVAVETQGAHSQWSGDVESLRRVRYHFEAACELRGCEFETVSISSWGPAFVPGARTKGKAAEKIAYRLKAQVMTNGETTNEDRCAAFGILAVTIAELGEKLYID